MDPNAALDELRRLLADRDDGKLERIAELFEALDGWIAGGGFLPRDWQRPEFKIQGITRTPMRTWEENHDKTAADLAPILPSDLKGIKFR